MNLFLKIIQFLFLFVVLCQIVNAQEDAAEDDRCRLELKYTTDLQSDFEGKGNWLNQLSLAGSWTITKNGQIDFQTISFFKPHAPILNDIQAFSNIDANNMLVNVVCAGYTHKFDKFSLFGGIRNVNSDYFIGEYASVFTNSSSGIYPTISLNSSLANYPLSGLCLHGEYEFNKKLTIKNSLYNGQAGYVFDKENTAFSFNPARDGIFYISDLAISPNENLYSLYNMGFSVTNASSEWNKDKKVILSTHCGIEQVLFKNGEKEIGVVGQLGYAPANLTNCSQYYALGTMLKGFLHHSKSNYIGAFVNHAVCSEVDETAMEFTLQYEVNSYLTLQPTIDYVITGKECNMVGFLRVIIDIQSK